jgi:virulence-associated protein VapD
MSQIDILQYPSLVSFITSISPIFKPLSNGQWIQALCPFCDDSTRKYKPDHGHFNIARFGNRVHCFRCEYSNSLSRAIISLGYNDYSVLALLSKNNTQNFVYANSNKLNTSADVNIQQKTIEYHEWFKQKDSKLFNEYLTYIDLRMGNIDPCKFFIRPLYNNGYLLASFYNYNGILVTSRYITPHKKFRYLIPSNQIKPYYHFQPLIDIDTYTNIIICEGSIDLINIYNYNQYFNNGFYISIGGKQFRKIIKDLITNYLLIGNYTFNIILDNDGNNWKFKKLITSCVDMILSLNNQISINFYYPPLSKDFSDLNFIEKL